MTAKQIDHVAVVIGACDTLKDGLLDATKIQHDTPTGINSQLDAKGKK